LRPFREEKKLCSTKRWSSRLSSGGEQLKKTSENSGFWPSLFSSLLRTFIKSQRLLPFFLTFNLPFFCLKNIDDIWFDFLKQVQRTFFLSRTNQIVKVKFQSSRFSKRTFEKKTF